jgi:hypothetical protein
MLHLLDTDGVYSPETVAVMSAAFDRACQSLSARINGDETLRETVALAILRHVNAGERDPMRLADVVLRELAGNDRSSIGDGSKKSWDARARIGLQLRT